MVSPGLPGSGAKVELVPTKDDLFGLVQSAGFRDARLTKCGDPPCFVMDGNAMRKTHIEAWNA